MTERKGNPDWVKGGKSPNPAGRTKGTKSAFRKSSVFIEAAKDLKDRKRFLRAIINSDEEVLADYGMTAAKVTTNNKLEARKQLNAVVKEEVQLEKAKQAEQEAEKRARENFGKEKKATFSTSAPSGATPIKQAV